MKKILSIALCAAAVSAFGDTTPTEAVLGGEIGVTAIESKLSNTVVAVSYDDLAGGTGMVYSNLVKTANLTPDDRLIEFHDGKYTGWVLKKDVKTGVMYWDGQVSVLKDSLGREITSLTPEANQVRGEVGTGIWLIRRNPTDESGNAKPFYIYGKPSTAMTTTTTPEVWNLVGNPTQGDVTITDDIVSGAQTGDRILVPAAAGLVDYRYKTEKGWRAIADASGNWGDAPTVTAGTGFWIMTKSAVTITWSAAQ